jgi:hypothetical protein
MFDTALFEYVTAGEKRTVPLASARVLEIRDSGVAGVTLILAGPRPLF